MILPKKVHFINGKRTVKIGKKSKTEDVTIRRMKTEDFKELYRRGKAVPTEEEEE